MNKLLKKIYYWFLWHNHIKYDYYPLLDILLVYLENVKISSINVDNYYATILFYDNSILKFLICDDNIHFTVKDYNRWYIWMSKGEMSFHNGNTIDWRNDSPSREVLYKYKKLILKYEKDEIIRKKEADMLKYNNCLPIKLVRKEKLKNIKK